MRLAVVFVLICTVLPFRSQGENRSFFSVPAADAPELAARGAYSVGVRTVEIVHARQIDILNVDPKTGIAPSTDRRLTLEVWYPATIPAGQEELTHYTSAMPGRPDQQGSKEEETFEILGKALRDAPAVTGKRFPLVLISHGYPGSRTFLTYLTENLASKGYVVAAIDHTDSVFGAVRGFPSTLLNRSSDQLFAIQTIIAMGAKPGGFLHGLIDPASVAIVGYSMGGYGALTSAGAGYSRSSPLMKFVSGGYLGDWAADNPKFQSIDRTAIKATVAIASWGEQPPYSAWDSKGLAGIRVPSLFIVGDHDDVADYANGVKRAFENAVNSSRYMLVYGNGRHNTGGNPPPPGVPLNYNLIQTFDEPVWRKERVCDINLHFITAFLGLYLKGDETRRKYLDVPVNSSDDGKWDVSSTASDDGVFSTGRDAAGNPFWPGFQRRWALGLRMLHYAAGQKPSP